jgi:hypothetical protein
MYSTSLKKTESQHSPQKAMPHSFSTKYLSHDPKSSKSQREEVEVIVSSGQLEFETKQFEWREKTEFPVVKTSHFRVKEIIGDKTVLSVEVETFPLRLAELKDLPLFKILYLLKEAIIGFERLLDRVGPFEVTAKMVALSQSHKCKVWLNDNFASNHYQKRFMS